MVQSRWVSALVVGIVSLGFWLGTATPAQAQNQDLNRFYYYPYYYFPHNYWPSQSPKWPERPGTPYMPPPAYMAYPPFLEPGWRYDLWEPKPYYRGFHFWLDQF
jgi:hypothetical protein